MTLTNTKAALGLATVVLTIVSIIGGAVTRLETRFAALDTRLGKLESAIRAMNATTPDERYRTLIKELMAQEKENRSPLTGQPVQRFGGNSFRGQSAHSGGAAAGRGTDLRVSAVSASQANWRWVMTLCENCFCGFHAHCIEQGCDCKCQVPEDAMPEETECHHGLLRSLCEQCEQEEN